MNATYIFFNPQVSPRLQFIANWIFEDVLDGKIIFRASPIDRKLNNNEVLINYSNQPSTSKEIFVLPHSLLFETNIKKQQIDVFKEENLLAFFQTKHGKEQLDPDFSFDIFAVLFYLISRYEEYLDFEPDSHGRFSAKQSLAFKENFIQTPLVDLWIEVLKSKIKNKFPQIKFNERPYSFLPTFDIDMAWAFLNKSTFRTFSSFGKDLLTFHFKQLKLKSAVFLRNQNDPFFQFNYMEKTLQKLQTKATYFILIGDYGPYDKNGDYKNSHFRKLIKNLALSNSIGIHPSYESNSSIDKLKEEKRRLSEIINKDITKSRQHYLKLSFPVTYQNLIEVGILEDYSMGYAAQIGYRASTGRSFPWFDLVKNESTKLKIIPFNWMDVTLKEYLKWSPQEAIEEVRVLIDQAKKLGIPQCSIWHNSSFSEIGEWEEWKLVFEKLLEITVDLPDTPQ